MKPSEAAAYPWGSLSKFPLRKRQARLEPGTVLETAGDLRDTRAGWRRYCTYLEFLVTGEESKRNLGFKKMSRGWCLGGKKFKLELKEEALRRGADLDRERFDGLGATEARAEARSCLGAAIGCVGPGGPDRPGRTARAHIGGAKGVAGGSNEAEHVGIEELVS